MVNSRNSGRRLILFCAGTSLLVFAGMYDACKPRPLSLPTVSPNLTITFTSNGTTIVSAQTPLNGTLSIKNRDILAWVNNSGTDLLVCMEEPNPLGRALSPHFSPFQMERVRSPGLDRMPK